MEPNRFLLPVNIVLTTLFIIFFILSFTSQNIGKWDLYAWLTLGASMLLQHIWSD